MTSHAAEIDDVRQPGSLDCLGERLADRVLVRAKICGPIVWRDHGKDDARAVEGTRQEISVLKRADEDFSALILKRAQTLLAPPDDTHPFTGREQLPG